MKPHRHTRGELDDRGHSALIDYRNDGAPPISYGNIGESLLARVVSIDWQNRTITCIGMHHQRGSGPWSKVPILSPSISQSEGLHWIPSIEEPEEWITSKLSRIEGKRDVIAVLLLIGGNIQAPVCIGFINPDDHEFSFDEPGLQIERHVSNIYKRITKNGTFEFAFPDGTYVKISPTSESIELTDLTAQNKNYKKHAWNIPKDNPRQITVSHPSGTTILIDQTGNISITSANNINISASGSLSISAPSGSINVSNVSLTSHTHYAPVNGGTTSEPR